MSVYFTDISEWQGEYTESNAHEYPHQLIMLRALDGTYQDKHFATNFATAVRQVAKGNLAGILVYVVYRPGEVDSILSLLEQKLGNELRPHVAVVIDVESWGGQITGNHSTEINALREKVIAFFNSKRSAVTRRLFLGRDRRRVLIYGNAYDLQSIVPNRGDAHIILADYESARPAFPRKVAQQFTDSANTLPFIGKSDLSVVTDKSGSSAAAFAKATGIPAPRAHKKAVKQARKVNTAPPSKVQTPHVYRVRSGDTMSKIAGDHNLSLAALSHLNPQVKDLNKIKVGQKINV